MFKKFIVSLVISATSMSAFAADNVLIQFVDGTQSVYKNVPEDWDNNRFIQHVRKDHPSKEFSIIKVEQAETEFWDSGWGTAAKVAIVVVAGAALWKLSAATNVGCMLPSDIAKDGSRCGGRAASVRPGGK
jgi:hypothetical protein